MSTQANIGTYVLHEHLFPCQASRELHAGAGRRCTSARLAAPVGLVRWCEVVVEGPVRHLVPDHDRNLISGAEVNAREDPCVDCILLDVDGKLVVPRDSGRGRREVQVDPAVPVQAGEDAAGRTDDATQTARPVGIRRCDEERCPSGNSGGVGIAVRLSLADGGNRAPPSVVELAVPDRDRGVGNAESTAANRRALSEMSSPRRVTRSRSPANSGTMPTSEKNSAVCVC